MIETQYLLNFGAVGVLAVYLMVQLDKQNKQEEKLTERMLSVIENNTIALTKFHDWIMEGRK